MMKYLIVFLFTLLSTNLFAKKDDDKKIEDPKIYSQKEFNQQLEKLLFEKMKRFGSENMVALSKELYEKERAIKLAESKIKQREDQVGIIENELTKKIKELQTKEGKILACLDEHDQHEKKRIDHMVDAISGMRPQNAADVLSVQDPDISVKILDRLPASKVSKIFNSMKKEISARLQKQYMNMEK